MTRNQLEYFTKVAEQLSYSRAAEELFISQSALSKAILSLEKELQVSLIIRKGKSIELTSEGQAFYECANDIINYWNSRIERFEEDQLGCPSVLRLGIPPTAGAMFFYKIIGIFRKNFPDSELILEESPSKKIEKMVLDYELDLGVVIGSVDNPRLNHQSALSSEAVLLISPDHPLAEKQTVSFADLNDQPFINISRDYMFHDEVADKLSQAGIKPRKIFESSHWEILFEMVKDGQACCILPKPLVMRYMNSELTMRSLENPDFPWKLSLIWRKDTPLTPAMKAFIQLSKKHQPRV